MCRRREDRGSRSRSTLPPPRPPPAGIRCGSLPPACPPAPCPLSGHGARANEWTTAAPQPEMTGGAASMAVRGRPQKGHLISRDWRVCVCACTCEKGWGNPCYVGMMTGLPRVGCAGAPTAPSSAVCVGVYVCVCEAPGKGSTACRRGGGGGEAARRVTPRVPQPSSWRQLAPITVAASRRVPVNAFQGVYPRESDPHSCQMNRRCRVGL